MREDCDITVTDKEQTTEQKIVRLEAEVRKAKYLKLPFQGLGFTSLCAAFGAVCSALTPIAAVVCGVSSYQAADAFLSVPGEERDKNIEANTGLSLFMGLSTVSGTTSWTLLMMGSPGWALGTFLGGVAVSGVHGFIDSTIDVIREVKAKKQKIASLRKEFPQAASPLALPQPEVDRPDNDVLKKLAAEGGLYQAQEATLTKASHAPRVS